MKKSNDWEALFAPRVLEEGYQYYEDGKASIISESLEFTEAKVVGTYDYDVDLYFMNRKVTEMSCDCKKASEGEHCKHMAAVLYLLEAQQNSPITAESATGFEILESKSKDELREMLEYLMVTDDAIRETVLNRWGYQIDVPDMSIPLINQAEQIIQRFQKEIENHEYEQVTVFLMDMMIFIDEELLACLRLEENYEEVFETIIHIVNYFTTSNIGEDERVIDQIYNPLLVIWMHLYIDCDDFILRSKMIHWMQFYRNSIVDSMLDETIDSFISAVLSNNTAFYEETLQMLQQQIATLEQADYNEYTNAILQFHLTRYIECMNILGRPKQERQAFLDSYYQHHAIRYYQLEELVGKGNTEEAIKLLEDSRRIDGSNPKLVKSYCDFLLSIYEAEEDDRLIEELHRSFVTFGFFDNYYYDLYKSLVRKEEWPAILEQILQQPHDAEEMIEIYLEEEMYDEIFLELEKQNDLDLVDTYEYTLRGDFPLELLEVYEKLLHNRMLLAKNRKAYQRLVYYLEEMLSYPFGDIVVRRIVTAWQTKYKNRRALLEELRSLNL